MRGVSELGNSSRAACNRLSPAGGHSGNRAERHSPEGAVQQIKWQPEGLSLSAGGASWLAVAADRGGGRERRERKREKKGQRKKGLHGQSMKTFDNQIGGCLVAMMWKDECLLRFELDSSTLLCLVPSALPIRFESATPFVLWLAKQPKPHPDPFSFLPPCRSSPTTTPPPRVSTHTETERAQRGGTQEIAVETMRRRQRLPERQPTAGFASPNQPRRSSDWPADVFDHCRCMSRRFCCSLQARRSPRRCSASSARRPRVSEHTNSRPS